MLIIDDLGTEPFNKNNLAFLFDVINERTANNKKIIINTNLPVSYTHLDVYKRQSMSKAHHNP